MKKIISAFLFLGLCSSSFAYLSGEAFWSERGSTLSPQQDRIFNGCYARLHMDKTHDFAILNMMGTSAVSDIDYVLGRDIEHDINYIEIGPKAVVRLYDNEDFVDYRGNVGPGSIYDDYDRLDMVDSLEVTCL